MSKLVIENTEIKTAYDLYVLYNDFLVDLIDDAEAADKEYDPYREPAYTVERVRENYQEIFEKVPHKRYKRCEDFEAKCKTMDLLPQLTIVLPKKKFQEEM